MPVGDAAMQSLASKIVFKLTRYHANPARQQRQLVFEPRDLRDQVVTIFTKEVDARDDGGFKHQAHLRL